MFFFLWFDHHRFVLRSQSTEEANSLGNMRSLIEHVSLSPNRDVISWELEASGTSMVKFAYAKLVRGPKVRFVKPVWVTRVPLKVRIFLWQAALGRLPSALNLQNCHGPSNGSCALCGSLEDTNHILFQCVPAEFFWSYVSECFGQTWHPNSMMLALAPLRNVRGQHCRLAWRTFSALARAL